MKNALKLMTAVLLASSSLAASAQKPKAEPDGVLTYSLPKTTISLEVEAVQETFHVGPYARYAEKYLGVKARQKDEVTYHLSSIRMVPYVEADQAARFSVEPGKGLDQSLLRLSSAGLVSVTEGGAASGASWRFPVQSQGDFSGKGVSSNLMSASATLYGNGKKSSDRMAMQQNMVVEKSLEKKAAEAAQLIFGLRDQRLKIVTGDTDANYGGDAMSAALNELSRLEDEYMSLFIGYSETQTQKVCFEVIPEAGRENQMYVAFRIADGAGLVPADNLSGKPVVMEIVVPEVKGVQLSEKELKKTKGAKLHYRIPAMCTVRIMDGMNLLVQERLPVYQLGLDTSVPENIMF